jgi:hypothetical protein
MHLRHGWLGRPREICFDAQYSSGRYDVLC